MRRSINIPSLLFATVLPFLGACAGEDSPTRETPGASDAKQPGDMVLLPVRPPATSKPTARRQEATASVLVPPPPKATPAPTFAVQRYDVDGPLAKAVPETVLAAVDGAFNGRLDLYAHAAPPSKLFAFFEADRLVGALLVTNKGTRHLVGRAKGFGTEGWFDFRGSRTDDGPMLGRPLELSRVSSRFGERFHPITGAKKEHRGIDYAAPGGTAVRATMDGVVKLKATDSGAGNHVKLRHGTSYETWYFHLNAFADGLAVGSEVKKGDVIGYVGSTGASTGPHLHYELHLGPIVLDPLDLLPSRSSEALSPTPLATHQARLRLMDALSPKQ